MSEHPSYSPDWPHMIFFIFPKIKETLIGVHVDDIERNTTVVLRQFHKSSSKAVLKSRLGAGFGNTPPQRKLL